MFGIVSVMGGSAVADAAAVTFGQRRGQPAQQPWPSDSAEELLGQRRGTAGAAASPDAAPRIASVAASPGSKGDSIVRRTAPRHSKKSAGGSRWFVTLIAVVLILAGVAVGLSVRKGSSITDGNHPLVRTARTQVGVQGGDEFWSWYGFEDWVDWCGCFVSWCADQNGYIESGDIPQFAYVQDGVNWFYSEDRFLEAGEEPEPGYIVFFDWNANDVADHVGIVAGTLGGRIFTIEGNIGGGTGVCGRKSYSISSDFIMGYGIVD